MAERPAADGTRRFVIISGGPGAGKSTLLAQLETLGYAGIEESGRAIIRDQRAIAGPALPWTEPKLFGELLLASHLRSYWIAQRASGVVFFDRGVPDMIGYFKSQHLPIPPHVHTAVRRFQYHPLVFLAPPWREIYGTDTERIETFDQAVWVHECMVQAYRGVGYHTVDLPFASVAERVEFVLAAVEAGTA